MKKEYPYASQDFKGVHYHAVKGKYEARVHGVYIGTFSTIGDALIAIGTSLNKGNEMKYPQPTKNVTGGFDFESQEHYEQYMAELQQYNEEIQQYKYDMARNEG